MAEVQQAAGQPAAEEAQQAGQQMVEEAQQEVEEAQQAGAVKLLHITHLSLCYVAQLTG